MTRLLMVLMLVRSPGRRCIGWLLKTLFFFASITEYFRSHSCVLSMFQWFMVRKLAAVPIYSHYELQLLVSSAYRCPLRYISEHTSW